MTLNLSDIPGDNFCIAPWTNLHVSMEGYIKPCCGGNIEVAKPTNGLGKVQDGDWSMIQGTSPFINEVKTALLNNQVHKFCEGCQERNWYSGLRNSNIRVDDVNDFKMHSVDIRWGTTCNLTCVYCDEYNSSLWSDLKRKVISIQTVDSFRYREQKAELFKLIEQHRDTIQRVNLVGGEPLLLKDNIQLLDIIGPDVEISVITNLNVPLANNEVYRRLVARDRVLWNISMENVGERFEYVRRGASWATQVENLRRLESDIQGQPRSFSKILSLYHAFSALNLPELLNFCMDELKSTTVNCETFLYRPEAHSFITAPRPLKEQSIQGIEYCYQNATGRFAHERELWSWLRNRVVDTFDQDDPEFVHKLTTFCAEQEARYFKNRFDFATLWPQYFSE